jgi:hypothetical protein
MGRLSAVAGQLGRARRRVARSPGLQVTLFVAVLLVVLLAGDYLRLAPG